MGGGRNSILIFVIKRWLDFQGYEMGGEQLLLRYPNNTGSPGSQPLAAASVPGKKKQPEGWAHLCLFIYLFDQRESRLYFSQSSICLCVCVFFSFGLSIFMLQLILWSMCLFVFYFPSLFVCLFVYMFEVTECWIPRVYALVGQLVFVGVDETNSKFLSTRTNFALPFWCFLFQGLKTIYEQVVGPRERRRVLFLAHDRLLFCWQMPIQTCPGEQRCRSKKGGGQVWRKTSSDYPTEPMKKKTKIIIIIIIVMTHIIINSIDNQWQLGCQDMGRVYSTQKR